LFTAIAVITGICACISIPTIFVPCVTVTLSSASFLACAGVLVCVAIALAGTVTLSSAVTL
jgi:hypothetical protein